jgi:hypothetical protein
MTDEIRPPFEFAGNQRVAANPQDKWVLGGDHITVITSDGGVFVHMVNNQTIEAPYRLEGTAPVGANAVDHFAFDLVNWIMVITKDGRVFTHEVIWKNSKPVAVSSAKEISGAVRVAANPQDKFVLANYSQIKVITSNGSVFAHDIDLMEGRVGSPYQMGPSNIKVAANPQDKHVLDFGNKIVVITNDGSVYAHKLVNNSIQPAYQLPPQNIKVAALPQDKYVLALGSLVVAVITDKGSVFGHTLFDPPLH